MNIPHARRPVRVKLPLAHSKQELDGAEVLPGHGVLALPELVADDALEVWACFCWFRSCCS